jgi:hypothetical protein
LIHASCSSDVNNFGAFPFGKMPQNFAMGSPVFGRATIRPKNSERLANQRLARLFSSKKRNYLGFPQIAQIFSLISQILHPFLRNLRKHLRKSAGNKRHNEGT